MVSVIVRTINRTELLENAIKSIASQNYRPIELIIINDSDTDTPRLLLDFAQEHLDDVIYYHNTSTHGRSYAANFGLQNARGNYVMFLDEDDTVSPEHIEKLVNGLEQNPDFSVAYTGISLRNSAGEVVKTLDEAWEPARLRVINYLPIHAVLFKRNIVEACGFDIHLELLEDWDFWLQLAAKNSFYHIPGVSGVYNLGSGLSGLSEERDIDKLRKSHRAVLQKWLPSFNDNDLSDSLLWLDTAMDYYHTQSDKLQILLQDSRKKLESHQELKDEYQDLRHKFQTVVQENGHLKEAIDSLLCSKSWKLTKPLRDGVRLMKLAKYALGNPILIRRVIDEVRILGFNKTLTKIYNKVNKLEAAKNEQITAQQIPLIKTMFVKDPEFGGFSTKKPIDILIPVYNGKEFLTPLFESIFRNTSMPYRLLVCDDKSSDADVLPLLKTIKNTYPEINFILLENAANLGFIKTVNKLTKLADNHFVLLNTDTEVPPLWIERLMYPIYMMSNIATTTPFTNAGTICSFPNYLEDSPIFEGMSVEEIDQQFRCVNFQTTTIELPTGVGFCMGVNKTLVDKIGMFDEIFGKGYGEENDWCQRAILQGYKNIHVTNLFVYHKHGGSFQSAEKEKLIRTNLLTLNQKHPTYNEQVQLLIDKDELKLLREMLKYLLRSAHTHAVIIFDHDLGGGANDYTNNQIEKRIALHEAVCLVRYDFNISHYYTIEFITFHHRFTVKTQNIEEASALLHPIKFHEIFVNSLVSYPDISTIVTFILEIHQRTSAKLIIPLHDFYPLCPSYTLLDNTMNYCGVPDDLQQCNLCLKTNNGDFKVLQRESDMGLWREGWNELLDVTDEVLCFSDSSTKIFGRAYPHHLPKTTILPHDISGRYPHIYTHDQSTHEIRIGILGGINEAKGATVIKNLVSHIDNNKLNAKVILIGQISIPISSPSLKVTGRYNKNDLLKIVKEENITQFLIPSVWPETFSYTTDEIIQMGYPLIVFNLGAPAERVKDYSLGKVIETDKLYEVLFGN